MTNKNENKNKEALLKAAEACVLKGEIQNLTMDVIARRAGLSRKTLYRVFKNKNDLLTSLIELHQSNSIAKKVKKAIAELDFEDSIVQGNLLTIRLIKKDPFLVETIRKSGAPWFQSQLMQSDSELHIRLLSGSIEMWEEKLDQLREEGTLNAVLSNEAIIEWFSLINYSLLMRSNVSRTTQVYFYKTFVVPPLRNPQSR
ncbi:MAG: TetR/AcrR family transcriptional regulator [Halieaceae bacterium]|nr:TetR/AcrR family transcriptional regulator [Halieaceae bacterium]